jgi:hypothetical protein
MAVAFPPGFPFHRPVDEQPSSAPAFVQEVPAAPVDAFASAEPRALLSSVVPQLVIAPAAPAPAVERRRAPRQTLVAKAAIRPDSAVVLASHTSAGFVSNISMNGVGFHTRKPLAIGEKYRITLELGPMKWSSRMRIVSCRHNEASETFEVGAEFVGNELSRQAA